MNERILTVSSCGQLLSKDRCRGDGELRDTFKDAYHHYLGRNPTDTATERFMRNREHWARNGVDYLFTAV